MLLLILSIILIIVLLILPLLFIYLYREIKKEAIKRHIDDLIAKSPYRNKKEEPLIPHNDFLARMRLKETNARNIKEDRGVEPYYDESRQINTTEINKDENLIVDVVKPQGFWSRLILMQKLEYIFSRIGAQKRGGGRWINFILAQQAARGHAQTKGRSNYYRNRDSGSR